MKTRTTVTLLVAGALTFAVARGGLAFGGGGGRGGFFGGPRLLHALDLSADQKQQVPGPVTIDDLAPLIQSEAQARTALMQARLSAVVDVRNVLTPAQIQKAATIRTGMKQLHAQMRELLGHQSPAD
jgi:Spy/CpxP family protein refolding chaperone